MDKIKQKLNGLKLECAAEVGISDYDHVDKGNLSSRTNGAVGGEMVKTMIADYEKTL